MTITGPTRILAALGAAVALSLSGPAYAGDGHASTHAAQPDSKVAATPAVGECHKMTVKQAGAKNDKTPVIDCSKAHNTRVIAVKDLPKGATYDDLTRAQLFAAVIKICHPAALAAVSRDYRVFDRTTYSYVWFEPTKQQRADGATWVRCDLTLVHGHTWGNLPTDAVPAVKGSNVPNSAKRCLVGKNLLVTTCTASHTYKSTGSFVIAKKKFPGRKQMIRIGNARCPALVSTRAFSFSWQLKPTYEKLHNRVMVCYSKTKH